MEKTYSPESIEGHIYQTWESNHYFQPQGEGAGYCIMLPPPNVTGSLHMGHGFQLTIMDALTRYHRMQGYATLWQPGTDHAGISTQLVVARRLEAQSIFREELTREQFLDHVWQWKNESGANITSQMRRMGASVDWKRERFTMDEGLSAAVQRVFIELYDEGLIYKGTRLVNWDVSLGTAVSDLEVITHEEQGFLWHIRYFVENSAESIIVATTRPETLLGDSAVAVHPQDPRFQHLIGKKVHLPLCNRTIPIIADDYVDPQFGSGCVKITPAHDFNDYEVGKRHDLPLINIFTKQATINQNAPSAYQGMDRLTARKQIIEDLEQQDALVQTQPYTVNIPRGEKSNDIIEPLLTEQWYVSIKPLAEPALQAVQNGSIRLIPETWNNTFYRWMEDIEDWCISRQLWWGHRIPAWYDDQNNIYVGADEQQVRKKYRLDAACVLRQDEDVLDTWFSSALWPFSTLGWPEKTQELERFYPTNVLVTGFDIIFFWVARMIMMSLKFTGKIPFKEVYITGLIRDSEGHKMSKSKGNVLDPLDIIDGIDLDSLLAKRTANLMLPSVRDKIAKNTRKEFPDGIKAYGTDALRFTYCALASVGRNIRFDLARVEGNRNFCNKLWNAARYVFMTLPAHQNYLDKQQITYSAADQWILSKLQHTIDKVHDYFKTYRFDLLAQTLYDFIWHQYCDWYLELSKTTLQDKNASESLKNGTYHTLLSVLSQLLKLTHPIMPFITEEIWLKVSKLTLETEASIMLCSYPQRDASLINEAVEEEITQIQALLQAIRMLRSETSIAPGTEIKLYIRHAPIEVQALIEQHRSILISMGKLSEIKYLEENATLPISTAAVVGTLELFIPLEGVINIGDELSRVNREMNKLNKDILICEAKLNNPEFVRHAPPEVIAKEQAKLEQARSAQEKLTLHKNKISSLQQA